jgi:hypothetical protein
MKRNSIGNYVGRVLFLVVVAPCVTALWARELPAYPSQLMQEVVNNELNAEMADRSSWRYLEQRDEEMKSELRDVVGTPDGYVYRTLEVNGEGSNSKAEWLRLEKLLSNPAELEHAWKAQQRDAEKLRTLMRMLPDAFVYRYDQEPFPTGRVRMSFEPNPNFHPRTTSAEIFRHLEGYVVVDSQALRLAEINAHLVSSAKFGGGILGHLESGGTVVFRQEDVGDGHWQPVFVNVNMRGRLLFLSFSLHQQIDHSDYEQLPDHLALKQIISLITQDSNADNAALR